MGNTYYVSSVHGQTGGNGLTPETAFCSLDRINELNLEAGDHVYLERGSVFEDQFLQIKGSGTKDQVIVIDAYGTGEKPAIHTNGQGQWYHDYGKEIDNPLHKYKGTVSSSILLYDTEYIEIRNLEITNDGADGTKAYNDPDVMNRTGVAGVAKDRGTRHHIYLEDLYVHDVKGNVYDKHMPNGGIYFVQSLAEDTETSGIPRYDDLQIRNCHVKNVNRWGIAASYTAYWEPFAEAAIADEVCKKYGSVHVVIEGNYVEDAGGDAITSMYCYKPYIAHNISTGAARQINFQDYAATEFGRVAAGIWPWKCKNALFEYNECYDTKNGENGNNDAQAWDADSADGTIYQYNYSCGNTGGAVMFCLEQAYRSTFRYNISQHDERGLICLPANPDAHIYNNTFIIKEGVPLIRPNMNDGAMDFENNLLYYEGEKPAEEEWYGENKKWDNNLYYNCAECPKDEHAIIVEKGKKILEAPGMCPTCTEGILNLHEDPEQSSVFEGCRPAEASPVLKAGRKITDHNGYEIEKDFAGRRVEEKPEIGAVERK